ncbi:MAG: hypothetical protein J5I50_08635 [Chitinophagaceae bacterium]|nr:hypothetical protein [Chitinophagaceae bacterium]
MNKEQKIESILNSLDGVERATPRPFFFTRLEARMQRGEATFAEKLLGFLVRPSVAIAAVVLIVVMNAFVVVSTTLQEDKQQQVNNSGVEIATVDQYLEMNMNPFDAEKVDP